MSDDKRDGFNLVQFPEVPRPEGIDEAEQYAVMKHAAKKQGGLKDGEDLTALPANTPPPPPPWQKAGSLRGHSGTIYTIYTLNNDDRKVAKSIAMPEETITARPPPPSSSKSHKSGGHPGKPALQDIDKNFSPAPPAEPCIACIVGHFALGFVEGALSGILIGVALGVLSVFAPLTATLIGVGLLLYSVYQFVSNWDKIKNSSAEDKAELLGSLVGSAVVAGKSFKFGRTRGLRIKAVRARNVLATQVGGKSAVVTAGYNYETGEVAAKASSPNADGTGSLCAEDNVDSSLDGKTDEFTKPVRPRTGKDVPVCERCELKYGRQKFPPDTKFKSDTPTPSK